MNLIFVLIFVLLIINYAYCQPIILLSGIYSKSPDQTFIETQLAIEDSLKPLFNNATNLTDPDDSYNIFIDGSIKSNIPFIYWTVFRYNLNELDIQDTIEQYSNFGELNNELKQNDYAITATSNQIFCDPDDDNFNCLTKIGPNKNSSKYFEPIAMNQDWSNLYNIIYSGDDYSNDNITVYPYFYVTGPEDWTDAKLYDIVSNQLFSNGKIIDHYSMWLYPIKDKYASNSSSWMLIFEIAYDDLYKISKDISGPSQWNKKFSDYYTKINNNDGLIYMYGMVTVCSNSDYCSKYYYYSKWYDWWTDEKIWMIVGIIFICLFVISLLIIFCCCIKVCCCNNNNNKSPKQKSKGKYSQPAQEQDDEIEIAEDIKVSQYVIENDV